MSARNVQKPYQTAAVIKEKIALRRLESNRKLRMLSHCARRMAEIIAGAPGHSAGSSQPVQPFESFLGAHHTHEHVLERFRPGTELLHGAFAHNLSLVNNGHAVAQPFH